MSTPNDGGVGVPALLERVDTNDQIFMGSNGGPVDRIDDPWEWMSDLGEEDEDTRRYLAQFEAQVEDAYKSEKKIRGCSVDMDWLAKHRHRSLCLGSAPCSVGQPGKGCKKGNRARKSEEDEQVVPSEVATHEQKNYSARPQSSLFEVRTAASLEPFVEECRSSAVHEASVTMKHLAPPQPSLTSTASGSRRPQKRRSAEPSADDQASVPDTEEDRKPHAIQRPSPPDSQQNAASGRLSKLRQAIFGRQSANGRPEEETAPAATKVMAGPPAIALRRTSRNV